MGEEIAHPPTEGANTGIPFSRSRGGTLPWAGPILTPAEPLDPQSPTHQSLLLKRLGEYGGGAAMPLCVPSVSPLHPAALQGHSQSTGRISGPQGGDMGTG